MAHQIETMFYQNETPWHGLGTYVDHAPTAEEAIKAAGLDWRVVKEPVYVQNAGGHYREIGPESQNHVAVRRDSDGRVFGVVGKQYTPLQNIDAFRFFDPFIESGYFEYETAGSLSGKRVWILAAAKDGIADVVPGDPIKAFVLLSNSHDGTSPVITMNTSVRVVCANTQEMAFRKGDRIATARHTRNVKWKVEEMQETFAAFHEAFRKAVEQYRFLAAVRIDEEQMQLFVKALFGKKQDDEKLPRGGARIIELFSEGCGNDLPHVRGTMWAAYNAVTQYVDHERGGDGGTNKLSKRLESAWFGQGAKLKRKALEVAIKGAMGILNAA